MPKVNQTNLYRIIDANFNRAKEGLRVCEDICRFILNHQQATRNYRAIRHQLTTIMSLLPIKKIIDARDIVSDVGKETVAKELKRKEVNDIFYANSQRIKESIRVLEEFTKLCNKKCAQDLKLVRYKIYALEKKIVTRS